MKKIVIIEDDAIIRFILKSIFGKTDKVYTSDDGVQGLGLVYLVRPDVIIVDTTLPKYNGLEIIDYLSSNLSLNKNKTKVIVINEGGNEVKLPTDYIVLDKSKKDFLEQLEIAINGKADKSLKTKLSSLIAKLANKSDLLMHKIKVSSLNFIFINKVLNIFRLSFWMLLQLISSFLLVGYMVFYGNPVEENIDQSQKDIANFRVKTYPTLFTVFLGLSFFVLQGVLFTVGGVVVFNTRVESIFASDTEQTPYEFTIINESNLSYDSEAIEINEDGAQLKSKEEIVNLALEDIDVENPELPISDSQQTTITSFPNTISSITTKLGLEYSDINGIIEESTLNNFETSTYSKERYDAYKISQNFDSQNLITYQISPDNVNWYYYNLIEDKWLITTQGFDTSNSIQELNLNLSKYLSDVPLGEIYFKVFLHSGGNSTPILNQIIIDREKKGGEEINNLSIENVFESEEVSEFNLNEFEPVIFNASYVNGEKVVLGKLLLKDKTIKATYNIDPRILNDYSAQIYFSNPDEATTNTLIGSTSLYLNTRNEIEFLLRTPAEEGGYVTAFVSSNTEGSTVTDLAKPVENSTFTVDDTGDGSDASAGNGVCATAGAVCTLMAAIQEANALAGTDNIYFNIPTSDSGYRDYDTPNTSSSGDSLGGDDYWTIRPTVGSPLPAITQAVNLDGATQTSNQGNYNTSGPEIEINGVNGVNTVSTWRGIYFSGASSASSTINSFVVNGFYHQIELVSTNNTITVTRNYLGTGVKGITQGRTNQFRGIYVSAVSSVIIGTSTSDGNVIAGIAVLGGSPGSVEVDCGATLRTVSIAGNIVGLGADGVTSFGVNSKHGIQISGRCNAVVGGDTAAQRNVVGNANERGMRVLSLGYSDMSLKVYNNFFGVDATGTVVRNNLWYDLDIYSGNNNGALNQIEIGASGKGNFFGGYVGVTKETNIGATIHHNTFANFVRGVYIYEFDTSATETDTLVQNNYFAIESSSDPYFGISYDFTNDYDSASATFMQHAIDFQYGRATIQGNIIDGYPRGIGIFNSPDDFPYLSSRPTIGGTDSLSGSLCGGTEKNCFVSSPDYVNEVNYAIAHSDGEPLNIDTLLTDNDFSDWTHNDIYKQLWSYNFELFSGTARRTDIATDTLSIPLSESQKFIYQFPSTATNFETHTEPFQLVTCKTALLCPASGSTSGINGKTMVTEDNTWSPFYPRTWYYSQRHVVQYSIDSQGVTHDYTDWFIDTDHFAAPLYSFDGDFSTDPTTSSRGDDISITIAEKMEPDIPTYDSLEIVDVDYVDANPILQDDNTYVITVDSTTSEDNVSTCSVDQGTGAYSGGGCGGLDGLPNGQTSLQEAVYVASQFGQPVTIQFAESITTLTPLSTITIGAGANSVRDIIDASGVIIDGGSLGANVSCLTLSTLNNFTFTNFTFDDCATSAIKAVSGSGNTFNSINVSGDTGLIVDLSGGTEDANKVTANDSGDSDAGANNLMNYPEVQSIQYIGGEKYRLNGLISNNVGGEGPFSIDVCESSSNANDFGRCLTKKTTISNITQVSGGQNTWSVDLTYTGDDGTQERIFTLLATNANGSSSEYSPNVSTKDALFSILDHPITLVYPINDQQTSDLSPLMDWNSNNDLDLNHYELYLDGTFTAIITSNITQYEFGQSLSSGIHTWQVVGIRQNGSESGRSVTQSFEIVPTTEIVDALYPNDIEIDNPAPKLQWTTFDSSLAIQSLSVFINGEEIASDLDPLVNEYQITSPLVPGTYVWEVLAYDSNGYVVATVSGQFEIIATLETSGETPIEEPSDGIKDSEEQNFTEQIFENVGEFFDKSIEVVDELSDTEIPIILASASLATVAMGTIAYNRLAIYGFIWLKNARRQKVTGKIYDLDTNNPVGLAVIRLYVYKNNQFELFNEKVSNLNGKYTLALDQGHYKLEVKHPDYETYSKELDINDTNYLSLEIPMKKLQAHTGLRSRIAKFMRDSYSKVSSIVFIGGAVVSFIATVFAFEPINIAILSSYLVQIIFLAKLKSPKDGKIYDVDSNETIKGAFVKIFDKTNNRQLDTDVTDVNGKYSINLPKGDFLIRVYASGYEQAEDSNLNIVTNLTGDKYIEVLSKKEQILNLEVPMRKVSGKIDSPFG